MTPQRILSLIVPMMAAALIGDLLAPLGIAGGVPYVIPVTLSLWLPGRRPSVILACSATVLILVGFAVSPTGALSAALVNRTYAMIAVWVVAVLEWWAKDGANSARASRQELIASQLDASAFRASGDATLLLDMNGAILAMNPAGSRMMGVTEEEAIGHRAREIVSVTRDDGTPYAERQSIVRQIVADGKERTTTAEQLTRRDGTATDVERTIAALRDPTRGTSSGQ